MLQRYPARSTQLDRPQRPREQMGASPGAPQSSLRKLAADEQTANVEFSERRWAVLGHVGEKRRINQPHSRQPELHRAPQHAEAVDHTALEIDRRRFREIFRRAAYLTDPEPEINGLYQHLIVENEIVRVVAKRQPLQHSPAPCPISGMIF